MTRPSPDFLGGFNEAKEMAARKCEDLFAAAEWEASLKFAALSCANAIRALTPPELLSKDAPEPTNEKAG